MTARLRWKMARLDDRLNGTKVVTEGDEVFASFVLARAAARSQIDNATPFDMYKLTIHITSES